MRKKNFVTNTNNYYASLYESCKIWLQLIEYCLVGLRAAMEHFNTNFDNVQ